MNVKLLTIDDIYHFFKPSLAKVWGDSTQVCVSWPYANGYMRWFKQGEEIRMEYIRT